MDDLIRGTAADAGMSSTQQQQIMEHLAQLQHLQSPTTALNVFQVGGSTHQRLKSDLEEVRYSNGEACVSDQLDDEGRELVNSVEPILMAGLLGFQAIPIRLKILLDRIFQDLPVACVEYMLRKADWTLADFSKGYVLNENIDGNSFVWVCASFYSELNLLHVASILLPKYAQLADSLRQTAIHSLLYTAVVVQQQQEVCQQQQKPTVPEEVNEVVKVDAEDQGVLDAKAALEDEEAQVICEREMVEDQVTEVGQSCSDESLSPRNELENVNEVETTISIVHQPEQAHSQYLQSAEGDYKANGLMTPPFVEDFQRDIEALEREDEGGFDNTGSVSSRKMSRKHLKSGKRRVECPMCFKVPGCDKIFSSRRSRQSEYGYFL